jgi:23S rRNA C2498 (ribose-2'-O)-methylase RlmM
MVEITLAGLNRQQQQLADLIWACETKDQVNTLIKSLPNKQLKAQAQSIVELMLMATLEQLYDGINDMAEANAVLDKIRY